VILKKGVISMNQKLLDINSKSYKTIHLNTKIKDKNIIDESNIYHGNLILVNKDYPINTNVIDKYNHQVPVDPKYIGVCLEEKAVKQFNKLLNTINSGDNIVPVSGYRSRHEQNQIYSDSIKENGSCFTRKYVALPGHSEHQTGLAIDVAKKNDDIDFICPDFPYTGICRQFRINAARYGFTQRYPLGKEDITGIGHEPWHFRYVSYPHSEIMQNFGFTLEEYIHFLRNFKYHEDHLKYTNEHNEYEIFYVGKSDFDNFNTIIKEEKRPYKISGNNVDGIIITFLNQPTRKTGVNIV
jgi:zinc D-Ala-D-Ala dipeptidase/carboxypeptidase